MVSYRYPYEVRNSTGASSTSFTSADGYTTYYVRSSVGSDDPPEPPPAKYDESKVEEKKFEEEIIKIDPFKEQVFNEEDLII